MKPTIKFSCNECGTHHDTPDKATKCCKHYFEVYYCSECEQDYDNQSDAENCCTDTTCVCGHARKSHEDLEGMCHVFLSPVVGDCPCMEFSE